MEAGIPWCTGPFTMPYTASALIRARWPHHQDPPGVHNHADAHGQGLAGTSSAEAKKRALA